MGQAILNTFYGGKVSELGWDCENQLSMKWPREVGMRSREGGCHIQGITELNEEDFDALETPVLAELSAMTQDSHGLQTSVEASHYEVCGLSCMVRDH